jgi:uncharacterized protein YjbJ (UPF0337 family)
VGEAKAKVKEAVGWATGDRKVEAEGRVEQHAADTTDPTTEPTDEAVEEEREEVREEHGDVLPEP